MLTKQQGLRDRSENFFITFLNSPEVPFLQRATKHMFSLQTCWQVLPKVSSDYREVTSGNEAQLLPFPLPSQRWEEKPRWDPAISHVLKTLFRPETFPAVACSLQTFILEGFFFFLRN